MSNQRSKTTHSSRAANAMNVPTSTAKKDAKELDLHSMTEEDLKSLQKKGKQTCCCCCCCCCSYYIPIHQRSSLTVPLLSTFLVMKQTRSCTTPFQASAKPKCRSRKLTSPRSCRQQRKFQGTRECHSSVIHPW